MISTTLGRSRSVARAAHGLAADLDSFNRSVRRIAVGALVSVAMTGCGGPLPDGSDPNAVGGTVGEVGGTGVGVVQSALGEPTEDRPNYNERVALYAGNRSRVDPAAIGWQEFPAVPPLLWHDKLGQSGRAHSLDMRDTPCFQHPSCDGTAPDKRILKYYTDRFATLGENIAAGQDDGQAVIHDWIEETYAPPGETGHRENMFSPDFHYVGLGYEEGGTNYHGYWTQDFIGLSKAPTLPVLASGSHWPEQPAVGAAATFGTVYWDDSGAAPDRVEVVVDGQPFALASVAGSPGKGAWEGMVTIGAGCHRYFFRSVAGSVVSVYPDGGTLGVAADGTNDCAGYQAGGVSTDLTAPSTPGSCSVGAGARSPSGFLSVLGLAALALLRRRSRTANR